MAQAALRDLSIIDADAHVVEPNAMWAARLDPAWQAEAPCSTRSAGGHVSPFTQASWLVQIEAALLDAGVGGPAVLETLGDGPRNLTVAGEPVWQGIPDGVWLQGTLHTVRHHLAEALDGFSAGSVAAALRQMGVHRAFMYPTAGLWVLSIDGMRPELASRLARAYNDWLADFVAQEPDVLRPVGALALHDPLAAADEVDRIAARGWTAAMVRPNPLGGRTLGDPALEPVFQACERNGVALAIHEGTHARVEAAGARRFSSRFGRHACSHPMEQMMAFLALVEGGVLERHPELQVAFLEAGCSWLPYWLWRLDTIEYDNLGWEVKDRVKQPPSAYFRRQCYVACEPDEPLLEQVVDLIGSDRVVYGSDYPHMDHVGDIRRDAHTLIERLGFPAARRILSENPGRLYRGQRR